MSSPLLATSLGSRAKYNRDEVGNRTKASLANDTYTAYDYSTNDPRYFITEIGHWKVGSPDTELGTIEYQERDGSGNPGQIQENRDRHS